MSVKLDNTYDMVRFADKLRKENPPKDSHQFAKLLMWQLRLAMIWMFRRCDYCHEAILPMTCDPPNFHIECLIRMVVGSVAHQRRECSCFGGVHHDPPNMGLRDAARLAHRTFLTLAERETIQ